MNSKRFIATDWLTRPLVEDFPPPIPLEFAQINDDLKKIETLNLKIKTKLAPFNSVHPNFQQFVGEGFNPNSFITPGWDGNSLKSKELRQVQKILHEIHQDAKNQFELLKDFPRHLKNSLFDEFINFCEFQNIVDLNISDTNQFWSALHEPYHVNQNVISQFVEIFTSRLAYVYFFRLRFATILFKEIKRPICSKTIFYTQTILNQIFPTGSLQEIKCKAFESGLYSWFTPSEILQDKIFKLTQLIQDCDFSDFLSGLIDGLIPKNIDGDHEDLTDSYQNLRFSHAHSHKNYGLLLNSLILNLPHWLNQVNENNDYHFQFKDSFNSDQTNHCPIEVISTLYQGDLINALAHSYYLAQENNRYLQWEQILCPDFIGTEFATGNFLRIIFDFHFLTFLAAIANEQKSPPIKFISDIMSQNYINKKEISVVQKSLFEDTVSTKKSTYNRVVLNLINFPKNNATHFQIGKLSQAERKLKEGGFLFLLSNRNLFISSQKTKIEALLKNLKLEAIFDFQEIEGKGDIAPFIYVFSKPLLTQKKELFNIQNNENAQWNFYNFRFQGKLNSFYEIENYTKLIQDFFIENIVEVPPFYQAETEDGKAMDFFSDAIRDGVIINSSSPSGQQITHPAYFKQLMRACYPLHHFFHVNLIDLEKNQKEKSLDAFLFSRQQKDIIGDYIIIVDKREKSHTRIEIIPYENLEIKVNEYGKTNCAYFEIISNFPSLDINLLRDFFSSTLGSQIINLTFGPELKKCKAHLEKLLIPKFFSDNFNLPIQLLNEFELLTSNEDYLKNLTIEDLHRKFFSCQDLIYQIADSYPQSVLTLISHFKQKLETYLFQMCGQDAQVKIDFTHKSLSSNIVGLEKFPLIPQHPDVFIEFIQCDENILGHSSQFLFERKTKSNLGPHQNKLQIKNSNVEYISIENDFGEIIQIYSSGHLLDFLTFLLSKLQGVTVLQILTRLTVPRKNDLDQICELHLEKIKTLSDLLIESNKSFQLILTKTVSKLGHH